MHSLLLNYSRWYRKKRLHVGYLWQGRYKSPLVDKESYFLECGRYIERNPVRAGLAARPENYVWSSYRHYSNGENDPLIDEDPYYGELGSNNLERQVRYCEFVSLEGPYDRLVDDLLIHQNVTS